MTAPLPDTRPAAPAPTVRSLDWSRHQVGKRSGKCRLCGRPALMRDELGKPCHKVCAEVALARSAVQAAGNYQMRAV